MSCSPLLFQALSRELDQKWTTWDMTQHSLPYSVDIFEEVAYTNTLLVHFVNDSISKIRNLELYLGLLSKQQRTSNGTVFYGPPRCSGRKLSQRRRCQDLT